MSEMESQFLVDKRRANSLFRSQAIETATSRYGEPVNASATGLWLVTGFVVLVLVLAVLFLLTTSFPRKETVSGSLVPTAGILPVTSQRSGLVSEVYVEEGAWVRRGDPIVRISVDSVIADGRRIGASLTRMAEEQGRLLSMRETAADESLLSRESGVRARMRGLDRQISTLRASVSLYEHQVRLADQTVADLERLVSLQIVSRLQFRDAEVRALTARQGLSETLVRISNTEQEREALEHDLELLRAERAVESASGVAELLSAREREMNYRLATEFDLVSQRDGRVTALHAKPGGAVVAGKTLGVVVPSDSPLVAEIWLPSSSIAFVKPGADVRLMYDAFPYQKFGVARARVVKISQSPTVLEELPLELQAKESRYRVLAALDRQDVQAFGKSLSLTPGMRLKADLILERRSAMDWLMEPLLAAKRRQD